MTVIEFGLEFLVLLDLSGGLHKVFMQDVVTLSTDGKHTRLSAYVSQISAVEVLGDLGNGVVVDFAVLGNRFGVNLQDVDSACLVGEGNFNLSIETTWSEKGGVEGVRSIGSHHHFDLSKIIETIELVKELHKSSLDLTIGT